MAPSATNSASQLTLNRKLNQLPSTYGVSDPAFQNFKSEGTELNDRVLKTFRCLIADLCEQFRGGHPGSAMGMAAIGTPTLSQNCYFSKGGGAWLGDCKRSFKNGQLLRDPKPTFASQFTNLTVLMLGQALLYGST